MLFTDNTSFLDNCADHMRAYFGIEDTDENISESVIGSVSECCNIGWDEKDGEYFRWEKGLTVCEMFEGLGESAILWHALLKLLGDNGGKTTHKYTRSFEIELPVGSGCIHKEEKQVSFNGNLFSEVLFPVMTALGKRNRRVSVSELVARLAKELDAAFDKKKEKLMDAIPLAEDAAYVWIRFSGYEPVTDGVEDKEKTAQRIAVQYAGGSCYEYVMRIYGQTVNYIDRIPQSERWLEENCGLEAPSVTIEEYENNVVCLSYDTEKALHGFKGIDGLIFLRAAASVSYQSGIQRIKKQMVNM